MTVRLMHVLTIPLSLRLMRGQVAYMRRQGYEVHIVTSPGNGLKEFAREEGAIPHTVAMSRRMTPGHDLRGLYELTRMVREVRPDILHAHTAKAGLLGILAGTLARTPIRIYHLRGLPLMTTTGAKRHILMSTERVACGLAHKVLCVSDSLRRHVIAEGLCPADKIEVLLGGSSNGVDADGRFDPDRLAPDTGNRMRRELGIPEDARVIGYVGRLVRDKGIGELAEAWRALRQEHDGVYLLAVGPFEDEDPVAPADAELLQTDPRIHHVAFSEDTPSLYAAMDVVTLPTYREGFPNVPLEAAAMRLPVVATEVTGCVDAVVHGETGRLVPPRDATALADALRFYLDNADERRAHGRAARGHVRAHFVRERIWEALDETYHMLLERYVTGRRAEHRTSADTVCPGGPS